MQEKEDKVRSGDRFMPCVLSRLTDQEPQNQVEHFSRGISIRRLKQDILRNIELILNSRSHPQGEELENDGEMINSVLGMGLSDFCGHSHTIQQQERLKKEILRQLRCFEPRINPATLTVTPVDESNSTSVIEMEIYGRIEVAPLSEELLFRSRLDLESGAATVKVLKE